MGSYQKMRIRTLWMLLEDNFSGTGEGKALLTGISNDLIQLPQGLPQGKISKLRAKWQLTVESYTWQDKLYIHQDKEASLGDFLLRQSQCFRTGKRNSVVLYQSIGILARKPESDITIALLALGTTSAVSISKLQCSL